MRLSKSILTLALTTLFVSCTTDALERKRTEAQECTITAEGEEICTKLEPEEDNSTVDDDFDDVDDDFEEVFMKEDEAAAEEKAASCVDRHELCSFWASKGECNANPTYMHDFCKKSCNKCPLSPAQMKKKKANRRTEEYDELLEEIAEFGVPQRVDGDNKDDTFFVIKKTLVYMLNFVHAANPTHTISEDAIKACTNNHELCAYWAFQGECENNPSYMTTKCAPSCQSCHDIDFETRCPKRPDDAKPALGPGDLNLLFENIVQTAPGNATDEGKEAVESGLLQEDGTPYYTVNVHSMPQSKAAQANDEGAIAVDKEKDLSEDPWVITLDNFLTAEECDHLISLGYKFGYKRSRDVGKETLDGSFDSKESVTRTSENSWCSGKEGCRADPVVQRILQRLNAVTGIPTENYEDFQMLKYEVGQFYRTHHDYIPHHKDRHSGPRILTFFLYLSDVEEAGGTGFPDLDITVTPKKGRALLWPSVLNYDPMEKDGRTMHEAKTVEKGTKFAANAWIHMYDFVEAHKKGCA